MNELLALLVIFAEPGFPRIDVNELPAIDGAIETRSVAELEGALTPERIVVWRHGSAFPAEAWAPVKRFLEAGGSLLYLGGEPFTRPVTGEAGARQVQRRNLAMLKALKLNQCYRVSVGDARLVAVPAELDWPARTLPADAWAAVLEPRLADTRDFPTEDGTPGSRDATITPLAHFFRPGEERFPAAAAALAIDRLRGPWAGGRWVFWLASTPPTKTELAALVREAARPPIEFRVDPTFGCFHHGEQPSIILRLHRPRVSEVAEFEVTLATTLPDGSTGPSTKARLSAGRHGSARVPLDLEPRPGLYRVTASAEGLPDTTTGFWIFDPELFASGDALQLDGYTLRRNGRPEPVVGTTLMSASVQRKFLFEPNAAEWDDAFAELASLKINLVRTGVWSGWRVIAPEPGAVNESWLRALEAFYLTARKHGIPVLFTYFAFLPETFGGENPYLDPRAIEGQRSFVSSVASRFAGAKEILWDLINEPSFSSPKHLWKCRPNGDEFEKQAFLKWLQTRYAPAGTSAEDKAWESVVRARWRLAPDDEIELPTDEDFDDRAVFEQRRPYRAADYVHFAQHAFTAWTREMTAAIRQAGSIAPITVGQDEGGLFQRPSPLFHHDAVDFTSMHTWWLNDALLWDGLSAKAAGKPLLISETGIMQRELLSGEALRDPEHAARLLSRKLAYAFAAGAFGVVQWCYHVNPYMASDNEAAIGLKRPDGSYKPEHAVLRDFAGFIARNRHKFDSPPESEVVVIFPSADQFSPRDHAALAVRRSVDVLARRFGIFPRLVADHRAADDLGRPKALILPACRGISEPAWRAITAATQAGSRLICSGWFETDDAGLPARRLGLHRRPLSHLEPTGEFGSRELAFSAAITESTFAASGPPRLQTIPIGGAEACHHPLPLEWADDRTALGDFYASALTRAGLGPPVPAPFSPPGMTVRQLKFRDAILLIAINESAESRHVATSDGPRGLELPPFTARMAILDPRTDTVLDATRVPHPSGVGDRPP